MTRLSIHIQWARRLQSKVSIEADTWEVKFTCVAVVCFIAACVAIPAAAVSAGPNASAIQRPGNKMAPQQSTDPCQIIRLRPPPARAAHWQTPAGRSAAGMSSSGTLPPARRRGTSISVLPEPRYGDAPSCVHARFPRIDRLGASRSFPRPSNSTATLRCVAACHTVHHGYTAGYARQTTLAAPAGA